MERFDIGTLSSRRSYAYALIIGVTALLWVAGIVSNAGNSLPDPRAQKMHRFCAGRCLCDGGVVNAALMARVCPDGWQESYRAARQKHRRYREMRRKRLRKRFLATPPPPEPGASGPNV